MSIGFWLLQSIWSFCVPTHWMSVLGWRSVISLDNKCSLMYDVRGKWWLKYITIFILGELSCQGYREVPETNISKLCTKSFLRMPCSIKWNTNSFTIFDYIIWYGKQGHVSITMVDQSHNIQWWVFKIWKIVSWNITQSCVT